MNTATTMEIAERGMRNAEWRTQKQRSRITHHASRITLPAPRSTLVGPRAFSLIELLIVISVIALLAALTFPAIQGVKRSAIRTRARNELGTVETVIERFQQKLGYYPPDNPANYALNQLYYELLGTTNVGTANAPVYVTLDGSAKISAAELTTAFGGKITGFVNCSRPGRGDDTPGGMAFVDKLKPSQFLAIPFPTFPSITWTVLGSSIEGPLQYATAQGTKINPWRYNSSNPQHNAKSFDLWIDVTVGDKTNRICNWSDKPLVVGTPYP
jgi:prepilin-type N-terminal cleavage/methylation domain-containing protein